MTSMIMSVRRTKMELIEFTCMRIEVTHSSSGTPAAFSACAVLYRSVSLIHFRKVINPMN